MYQHIIGDHDILIDEDIELGKRTPCKSDADDSPNKGKGKGKGKADSDDD